MSFCAHAQTSRRMAETVVGERVAVERVDGSSVQGVVRGVDDLAVILVADDGQLQEVALEEIRGLRLAGAAVEPAQAPVATAAAPTEATQDGAQEDAAPAAVEEESSEAAETAVTPASTSEATETPAAPVVETRVYSVTSTSTPIAGDRRAGVLGGATFESEITDVETQSTMTMTHEARVRLDREDPDFARGRRSNLIGFSLVGAGTVAILAGTAMAFTGEGECDDGTRGPQCRNKTPGYAVMGVGAGLALVGGVFVVRGNMAKQRALRIHSNAQMELTPTIRRGGFGGNLRVTF